eukprot:332936-Prymnesium_polylepis.1
MSQATKRDPSRKPSLPTRAPPRMRMVALSAAGKPEAERRPIRRLARQRPYRLREPGRASHAYS